MFVVGLTGGIGSGKSFAAKYLAKHFAIEVIDTDVIAREQVVPQSTALQTIAKHFGTRVLHKDGSLNRRALREIIFSNKTQKKWLEDLLHPLIYETINQRLQKPQNSPYRLLMSPLLLETEQYKKCDYLVVVDVPLEVQIKRVQERDRVSEAQVRSIIQLQASNKKRRQIADTLIENHSSLQDFEQKLEKFHRNLLKLIPRD